MANVPKSRIASVAPETPLQTLVYDHLLAAAPAPTILAVRHGDDLLGFVTAADIRPVASVHWSHTQAQDVMQECSPADYLAPTTPLEEALELMEGERLGHVVVSNGDANDVDVVSYNDVIHFLQGKQNTVQEGT